MLFLSPVHNPGDTLPILPGYFLLLGKVIIMSPQSFKVTVTPEETKSIRDFIIFVRRGLPQYRALDFTSPLPSNSDLAQDDKKLDGSMAAKPEIHEGGIPLSDHCQHLLGAAADNLESLLAMLHATSDDNYVHIQAHRSGPYSLIRSSLEASVQVCWLLSPADSQERASRRLGMQCDEIYNKGKAIDSLRRSSQAVLAHPFDLLDETIPRPASIEETYRIERTRLDKSEERYKSLASGLNISGNSLKRYKDASRFSSMLESLESDYPQMREYGLCAAWQICSAASHGKHWGYMMLSDMQMVEDHPDRQSATYIQAIDYNNMSYMGQVALQTLMFAIQLYKGRAESRW